jgi:hypothetical protein
MAPSRTGQSLEHPQEKPRPWRRRHRDFAYVLWASFLMACAAAAVFFAMVDPLVLSGTTTPGWEISREAGYAIGFFGFWLLTAATAGFVIWLVRTENGGPTRDGQRPRNDHGRREGGRSRNPFRRRLRPPAGTGPGARP